MSQILYSKLLLEGNTDELDKSPFSAGEEDTKSSGLNIDKAAEHNGSTPPQKKDMTMVMTRDYYGLAETVGGNHSCLLLFTNRTSGLELRDPVVYTKTGITRIPPDGRIPPESNAYCAFRKPSIVIKGTCGVMSYEYNRINGHSKRFAVMWKVPYRIVNNEENEVAATWLDVDLDDPIDSHMHTDRDLYKELSQCQETTKGGSIMRTTGKNDKNLYIVNPEDGAELDITFSGSCKAIVKVDFSLKSSA